MNDYQSRKLRQELRQAGAEPSEINQLARLAGQVGRLKKDPQPSPRYFRRLVPAGLTGVICLVLGFYLVVVSQPVLPGSLLFPVQKLSDGLAVDIRPAYRATVMIKRAQQVKMLADNHADDARIVAAVADYQSVSKGYKFSSDNYDVLEFCHSNLSRAADSTHGQARQAIEQSLYRLPDS